MQFHNLVFFSSAVFFSFFIVAGAHRETTHLPWVLPLQCAPKGIPSVNNNIFGSS